MTLDVLIALQFLATLSIISICKVHSCTSEMDTYK